MTEEILNILISAVLRGAVEVINTKSSEQIETFYKDRTELVTSADKRSDRAIRSILDAELSRLSISFDLEESGQSGPATAKRVGADPLDGTYHFAAGGTFYSVQAFYVDDGVPVCGVVFQPEVFLPLAESQECQGRLVYASRGTGAWMERTVFAGSSFSRGTPRRVKRPCWPRTSGYVACVPFSTKMTSDERARTQHVHESGIIAATTGVGGAGGNVMMTIFGGQHVYANFGAGVDLDLIPPQVIAQEAGMTVWGVDRRPPIWHVKKQPFIVAPSEEIAEAFLAAAGL